MPKVGGKRFKYTKAGVKAAKQASAMTEMPMEMTASARKKMGKMMKGGKKGY